MNNPTVTDEEIGEALFDMNGNFTAVCIKLSKGGKRPVTRSYLKDRISNSPLLIEVLDDIRESALDAAERNVFEAVRAGRIEESKFVLTTLGRERGYTRQIVVSDADTEKLVAALYKGRKTAQPTAPEKPG